MCMVVCQPFQDHILHAADGAGAQTPPAVGWGGAFMQVSRSSCPLPIGDASAFCLHAMQCFQSAF